MRKLKVAAVAMGVTIAALLVVAPYIYGVQNVAGTKHNLAASGGQSIRALTVDDVCVFCHTPHRSLTAGPLWNHTLSPRSSYSLYSSGTLLSPLPPGNMPDGDSLLCLSCHDGDRPVGAVQNIGGQQTTISMVGANLTADGRLIGPNAFTGGNLSGHHPISIEINQCLVDDKASLLNVTTGCGNPLVSWKVLIPIGVDAIMMRKTNNRYPAGSGNTCSKGTTGKGVQCSSCHDAHSTNAKFLRKGAVGAWSTTYTDALCIACHIHC
ncbi:MAG: hypothetical protein M0Z79_02655 [Nitrospiraceae bacterium]|nr:hypothetical protein [Nitrospiraceae bacterium]